MKIYKAYKFRLYPNNEQKHLINKTLGVNRFIYNYYLNKKKETYQNNNIKLTNFENIKDLKTLSEINAWIKEVDSMTLRTTLFDLDDAYKNFYRTKNYPQYKKKNNKNTFRTNFITSSYKNTIYENIKVDLNNKTITLPKLKQIKIKGYRNTKTINGRIINATVSKEVNKYYISVLYEQLIEDKQMIPSSIIGIDLGIKTLITTSEGIKIDNKKSILKYEQKIKGLQKSLSRKQKYSINYKKVKQKIQAVYQKLKNARKYYIHHITKQIIKENDIIVTENLGIKEMIKKSETSNMNKYINDASLSEIIRQLQYKTRWSQKYLYQVEANYPSSQLCNKCNYQNKEIKNLNIRNWTCPNCNNEHDRDINAAINIMSRGIEKYIESGQL